MAEVGDRLPRGGYKRWVHPFRDSALRATFDQVLLQIAHQLDAMQTRRGCTLQQLADGTGLSGRGLLNISKTRSDIKVSTLVRIARFFDCDVVVTFRPRTGTAVQ